MGATMLGSGVNVAVFSAHATSIELCLFDADGVCETERIALRERTGDVFHAFIPDVAPGARYGLRARGPFDPLHGHRFNYAKLLIDPYARALDRRIVFDPSMFGGEAKPDERDSAPYVAKGVVVGPPTPGASLTVVVPWDRMIVYELHIRGFTKAHPGIPEAIRGTCAGLAHPAAIAHLTRLGVTTVEFMPIAASVEEPRLAARSLTNYWRYNPIAWMVPDPYLVTAGIDELAECVAALHAAGIEVIQDIVLNHSGEGDVHGPTLSLRGLDNATYYRLHQDAYADDTGCGNTLALDRAPVCHLALDALRHFALVAGVDGFRLDLGTALGRHAEGFDPNAPLFEAIAQDPVLRHRKMIVEPWDVGAGGYRLGAFPAGWGEWNDRCRDAIRRFWMGSPGAVGELATRLAGSSDVFANRARPPSRSVNFVTAHDGFTLADLVSYAVKHNDDNGEDNRDGADANYSWNHGAEGATDDASIIAARKRDVRSLLATLMIARGTPMLSMGDELGRTQHGNNNAYCQDNAGTWVDWTHADGALIDFSGALCALRRDQPALRDERWLTGEAVDATGIPDVEWRRPDGQPMAPEDWAQQDLRVFAVALYAPTPDKDWADRVFIAINAGPVDVDLRLPAPREGFAWRCVVNTALPISAALPPGTRVAQTISAPSRSVVIVAEERKRIGTVRRSETEGIAFSKLVAAAGILTEWVDVHGERHRVSLDTQRALLAAMGIGARSETDARARLRELAAARRRGSLPAVVVARNGEGVEVALDTTESTARRLQRLRIRFEQGGELELRFDTTLPSEIAPAAHGGRAEVRRRLRLPAMPLGIHELSIDDDGALPCTLVVAPPSCHIPDAMRHGERRFGLAAPLYALRRAGDQGIGDFTTLGAAARATARAGGSVLGINPLHALFAQNRERASPYHPSDRRFIDPMYIDIERVTDFDASREARAVFAANGKALKALAASPDIDYRGVWRVKRAVLDACFATFDQRPEADPLVGEFNAFVREGGSSLRYFALFEALSTAHPRTPWRRWPRGLRDPRAAQAGEFAAAHVRDLRLATYMQWQADRQLRAAAAEARASGLGYGLYRDLAVGAAPDGAETWANSGELAHGVSIGAPPDRFSPSGQVWNLPPAIPHRLVASGYARWRALLAANMHCAGALRIDHVMGLTRLFWVPDGARATEGAYVAYPLDDLLGVLAQESARARCLIVGEDLGTVPSGLRDRLASEDILSCRVLWFERDDSAYYAPARYPIKAAASVSTHDLPTIAGWWAGADIRERSALGMLDPAQAERELTERAADRALLAQALDRGDVVQRSPIDAATPHDAGVTAAIHHYLARSPAAIMLVQADDLVGETAAQNLPNTDRERPNWRRRIGVDASGLWDTRAGQLTAEACAARRATPEP